MRILQALALIFLLGCTTNDHPQQTLFTDITIESGVAFRNELTITEQLNPYTYRNFYNGAGVAIGDINNDGLQDIYFAGNLVDNKLYLNQGSLIFKDITESAGVACHNVWSTGVTFVDINGDGLLDIYVCKSGNPDAPHRYNELFINNGNLTFTEKSKEYGLDITGLSVQASFFDYDKDGDLDCYLLTNSIRPVGNYDLVKDQRDIPDAQGGGNKFFINENGKFRDYSEKSGIYRSNIGFGLGITLGDFNNDTWTDIFVSNDFFERDYLYINDHKGGFKDSLTSYFQSISMGSMGADFADLDNDGSPELFVTEMLPDSLSRKKTKTVFENWNKYQLNVANGYYHQFPRNVLQKRIGKHDFAEIGRWSGVAASEWSWGALLFDMDNDGLRDIFVANGIYKDLLDRDYLAYSGATDNVRKIIKEQDQAILKLIDLMPSSSSPNYAFKNEGDLRFVNVAGEWGLAEPNFSSGSAYGDLDNDGDLDLIINNLNSPSVIYRNNSDSSKLKSISVSLAASGQNSLEVGSELTAFAGTKVYYSDNFVTRGFQSSVSPKFCLGLGSGISEIDSLMIRWPEDGYSMFYHVPVNKELKVNKDKVAVKKDARPDKSMSKVSELQLTSRGIFKHKGSDMVDFNRDRLLPMMYSNETPSLTTGDINNDGLTDVYIGGGKDQAGTFITYRGSKFEVAPNSGFDKYKLSEETKGALFDADGDGDLDLYMATGGRFFPTTSSAMIDHILINNGRGVFTESPYPLPFGTFFSTSVAKPIDFDNDGDLDLLVGERFDPFNYGSGGRAYLLENNGHGLFKDVTKEFAPMLTDIGMVTDAIATDINKDGWMDIVMVGDWMPVIMLTNSNKHFVNFSKEMGTLGSEGWWHAIETADFNKDGKPDFVVANHGLNSFFKVGDRMYVADFDGNGSVEQLFCTKIGDRYFPVVDKDELLSQLPALRKSLLYYKDYSKKSIDELFPKQILDNSRIFEVKILSSTLLLSGTSGYQKVELPSEAQYSPLYAMLAIDMDKDGVLDLVAGGNQYLGKPQFGRYDASKGWWFKGILSGSNFSFDRGKDLGIGGQIRDIKYVEEKKERYIFFAKYDDDLEIYKIPD